MDLIKEDWRSDSTERCCDSTAAQLALFTKQVLHDFDYELLSGPGYTNPYASDMSSPFSDPSSGGSFDGLSGGSWEDKTVRRMFIRKVPSCSYLFQVFWVVFEANILLTQCIVCFKMLPRAQRDSE